MAITAAEVNKLRQITGSGMMDCKNALVEAEGDFDKAIDILRKKGQKIAAKRADRSANEGFVVAKASNDATYAAVLMLNCETDFVGKTDDFTQLASDILNHAVEQKIKNLEQLKESMLKGQTIEALLTDMSGKTGEKIELNQFNVLEDAYVSYYNHNGNRLASIVAFNKTTQNLPTIGHEIAMQVAAMNPISVNEDSVPDDVKNHELEIAKEQVRNEGKPENMVEKIAMGKLNKFFKENTLINQDFIRDNKKTVKQYMVEEDKDLVCKGFYRLQLGA
ncbi:MAG: translation elongation factor Ts [Bacteroidales bacterium]|jgi:elongation factor Ts|nr:translation elongation factor Ts [Bacteroidales bacterium]MDD2687424.1 translation elongation factor Ts [Bacteroidales bacterium]MDD3330022.1 translation elongation factor Ts [Bacteroidales bacterium]MDD3690829.1 translation elongation factor Ts [Bacteroidales bacterium]MDD4044117.1 translation elongation factor Ts [Bacteroidales bacterium]